MGSNFDKIAIGSYFQASDGETYKKTSQLTYDDAYGMERNIDMFFDKKIGAKANTPPVVDISAKVVKSAADDVVDTSVKKKSKKKKKVEGE